MIDHHLDCRNLTCPMPIVKVSRAIKAIASGETLAISASDAAFQADLEAWVSKTGHALVEFRGGAEQYAVVKKA
jgi:TusA-related sulfurtransferase